MTDTRNPKRHDASQIPLAFTRRAPGEMQARARELLRAMRARRSVRQFSTEAIPLEVVRTCIEIAAQAPSGANKQPWTFALVTCPTLKRRIREAAETEEAAFYGGRAPATWLADLEPIGTDAHKPFLEDAPALIVVFAQANGEQGERYYYVRESVGIAVGMLLTALHLAGLATLTHTPSPMGFLSEALARPANERAYMIIPVGYPAEGCTVPDLNRKTRDQVIVEPSVDATAKTTAQVHRDPS